MIQINLLPWREAARQEKRKRFGLTIGAFVVLSIFLIFLMHLRYAGMLRQQNARTNFLKMELAKENGELTQLNEQVKEGELIDDQLHFLTALRENSYKAVSLLDELARVIPEAVSLSRISRNETNVILFGKAVSDVQITLFMKNMTKSRIFSQPVLTEINARDSGEDASTFFQLMVKQKG